MRACLERVILTMRAGVGNYASGKSAGCREGGPLEPFRLNLNRRGDKWLPATNGYRVGSGERGSPETGMVPDHGKVRGQTISASSLAAISAHLGSSVKGIHFRGGIISQIEPWRHGSNWESGGLRNDKGYP